MKRISLPRLAVVSVTLLLAACGSEPPQRAPRRPGFNPPPRHVVVDEEPASERTTTETRTESEAPHAETRTQTETTTEAAAPKVQDGGAYEYGKPVPGKPGFVTSPYAPYAGYVDVRGFMSGDQVKDPYTQKIFLVP